MREAEVFWPMSRASFWWVMGVLVAQALVGCYLGWRVDRAEERVAYLQQELTRHLGGVE